MLEYLIRQPKNEVTNPPALIMLHGYGSNEQDLFSFAEELPDELLIISARAPLSIGFGGYAWYNIYFEEGSDKFSDIPQAKASLKLLNEFIEVVKEKYQPDPNKFFLMGFSQGTILSMAYAINHPEQVNYVIGLSGYLNQELIEQPIEKSTLKKLDFYVSHGTMDQVIPVDWARKTGPSLDRFGIQYEYQEYPAAHGVAPQNFYDFKAWIEHRL